MLTTLAAVALMGAQSDSISNYVQTGLRDASFTIRFTQSNFQELDKINSDFSKSYRFKSTTVKLKEPFKLRTESTVEDSTMVYVINGKKKHISVPKARIGQTFDCSKEPGKLQTWLDFGVLTPGIVGDYYTARFVRADRATGESVFDLTYVSSLGDGTRNRVWMDKRKFISKREWYSQMGNKPLLATFIYSDPVEQNGAYFPTKLTVKNADNKVAGVSTYQGMKLNSGLVDSLFAIK